MDPEKYKEIATLLASRREAREEYVADVVHRLNDAIGNTGIAGELTGRPKHIYSIYRKMMERGVGFDQIYDLAAVRVGEGHRRQEPGMLPDARGRPLPVAADPGAGPGC